MPDINEVYTEYFSDVYKYLLVLCKNETLAEEITQETFFKALKNINKFKGECSVYSWLCQIARNTFFTYQKKQKRIDNNLQTQYDFEVNIVFESLEQTETVLEIHKALHSLDEPYKEVFYLKVFSELPYSKIAEIFCKSESWARVTYHRAKLKIKEKLL